jgi:hypothetical protein
MDEPQPSGLEKLGAIGGALLGLILIYMAVDVLRPRKQEQPADDD